MRVISQLKEKDRGNMNENMSATKTGYLSLATDKNPSRQVRLMAEVYTNVSDPFIVFYTDSSFIGRKPRAFLRLKSCTVTENDKISFTLTPHGERIGSSTRFLCFKAETLEEQQEWLRVFRDNQPENERTVTKTKRRKISPRVLPVIQESCSEEIAVVDQKRSSLIPV